ncbi:TIGR03618 family F420-dependent PPOX class oxidoreductase [Haloactinomyces albus]|uniref:PPOX class probable F420-dependent enzyme n=1 Tax=Haloactinomyces albus TaxID=1352928 RepID=A0AAE4CJH6_9ACTN|nr:TIGR03618 family F420-dependent PPOX class oxidoreductase [Haloactinomyces albus]MDR7300010.1 PPOX class probable F420-dependent enzyme [Haloactinomyces albus]
MVVDLPVVERIAARDNHLATVATTRADGSVQSSVVNAGVARHPITGRSVVAFVTYGRAKLTHLRARPRTALTFRAGWSWITVEGSAEIVGPKDPLEGVDAEGLRLLLREVFAGAGGEHEDWQEYDRAMAREQRAAVLIDPERIYGV